MLGKTFKGMTDETLAWQTERFLGLETHREGHVVHVRPAQVVEIALDGLQRSTRYPAASRCASPGSCATATTRPRAGRHPRRGPRPGLSGPTPRGTEQASHDVGAVRVTPVPHSVTPAPTMTGWRPRDRPTGGAPPRPSGAGSASATSSPPPASCSTANGVREAQIEDVARAVGINGHHLPPLHRQGGALRAHPGRLPRRAQGVAGGRRRHERRPRERLVAITEAFVDYGLGHPAFVDCAQTLMRRTGPELWDEIAESAITVSAGRSRAASRARGGARGGHERGGVLGRRPPPARQHPVRERSRGAPAGRVGILVKEAAPGVPTVGTISADQVTDYLVTSALALATGGVRTP